jgi:RNA polymerase sigma factor (sigma-70 family)
MFEAFHASQALLESILWSVSVFSAFILAVPALHKLRHFSEAWLRLRRRRSRNPFAIVDFAEQNAPSPTLQGPLADIAHSTRNLLCNIGGLVEDARNWPTDDLDRKATGLFSDGVDLDRVTYVMREVWEWVQDFDRLPRHVRDELSALEIHSDGIRAELVSDADFFDRLRRIVGTLHGFDLRLQQTGAHPFRGFAAPTPHLSIANAREHRDPQDARREEYEQVMAEHGSSISGIAGRYARDSAEREDLQQDIALAVWRALPRFRGESSVRTYVLRIAHNCGCAYRKKKRIFPNEIEVEDPRACPEAGTEKLERKRRLTGAMAELPSKLRDVMRLRLLGHSYAEISDELAITETNVSVRLTRARRFLKERLLPTG